MFFFTIFFKEIKNEEPLKQEESMETGGEDTKPKDDDSFEDGQIAEEETPAKVEKPAPVRSFLSDCFCVFN